MNTKYSNAGAVTYKNGKWVHAQGDNKGGEVDSELQPKLTEAYIGDTKASGEKYGIGSPDVTITPDNNKETNTSPPSFNKAYGGDNTKDLPTSFDMPDDKPENPVGSDALLQLPDFINITQQSSQGPSQTPNRSWADYAKFYAPEVAGTGFDIARGILGFNAARKPLPTWNVNPEWGDYLGRLKNASYGGLSGAEMSAYENQAHNAYAGDVYNIYNASGGNAGMALGNLGRAATDLYSSQTNIAALNNQIQRQNLAQYGAGLGEDINIGRTKFNDKFQPALWSKQEGAQVANDSIKNMMERSSYIQQHAPGSYYDQVNQLGLQQQKSTLANTQALKDKISSPDFWKSYSNSTSSPNMITGKDGTKYINVNGQYVEIQ